MVVALIIACEVGFWVLLALGLAARYLLEWRRTSVFLLLCEPVLELVLFAATAIDLKNGAEPGWEHAWRRCTSATRSRTATTRSAGSTATPPTAWAAARPR